MNVFCTPFLGPDHREGKGREDKGREKSVAKKIRPSMITYSRKEQQEERTHPQTVTRETRETTGLLYMILTTEPGALGGTRGGQEMPSLTVRAFPGLATGLGRRCGDVAVRQ